MIGSRRVETLEIPDIIKMRMECERLKAINLAAGTCELPPPPALIARAKEALDNDGNLYSLPPGIPQLRQAIAAKLARDNGIGADPDSEIFVTVGATGAFAATVMALLEPGDGIILLAPFYPWHRNASVAAGCVPTFARLAAPDYRITPALLESARTPTSRAIVLCTPSNPTGRIYDAEELRIITQFAIQHDLLVITDEAYEYIVFDGRRHVSPASLPGLAERSVTIMTCSKTFNVTGWRIGYVVSNAKRIRKIALVHDAFYTCAPTPLQHGAVAGLELPPLYYEEFRAAYQRRRDKLVRALRAARLDPIVPDGTCFVLARFEQYGFASANEAVQHVLQRARVAAVPSRAFSTQDQCDARTSGRQQRGRDGPRGRPGRQAPRRLLGAERAGLRCGAPRVPRRANARVHGTGELRQAGERAADAEWQGGPGRAPDART